jgi:hypothetical protein
MCLVTVWQVRPEDVFRTRNRLAVPRVYTRFIVAKMVKLQTFGNKAYKVLVGKAMPVNSLAARRAFSKFSIALVVLSELPFPTLP